MTKDKGKKKDSFRVGDTVRIHAKVSEGSSERIQVFEGVVLKIRGTGISKSFTVRKISFGVGVEKTFPVDSPRIDRIEMVRTGKVRRAKLYYLRQRQGKSARLTQREEAEAQSPQSATQAPSAAEQASAETSTTPPAETDKPKVETASAAS